MGRGAPGLGGAGRGRGPGRAAVLASLALHAAAFLALWAAGSRAAAPPPAFRVYRVNIVSAPPQEFGPPEAPAAPAPRIVAPPRAEAPKPKTTPAPRRPPPSARRESSPSSRPARGWNPRPGADVGGEGLNVQLEGEQCPDPEYCDGIIRQIYRYFRWTGAPHLRAEVYFVIRRDGSVEDLRIVRPSGSLEFDFEAMGAIEQAGRRKAFGPLPPAFGRDRLPILFEFRPPG